MPSVRDRDKIARRLCLLALLCACQKSSDPVAPLDNPPPPQTVAIQGRLAFVSTRDGSPYLYIGDSTGIRRLTRGLKPSWSPDGRRIAFHRFNGGISVINVDGSDERLVVADGANPAWSPDGQRIAFNTAPGNVGGMFVMNVDGSGIARLVSSDFVFPGDWIGLPTCLRTDERSPSCAPTSMSRGRCISSAATAACHAYCLLTTLFLGKANHRGHRTERRSPLRSPAASLECARATASCSYTVPAGDSIPTGHRMVEASCSIMRGFISRMRTVDLYGS